MIQVSKNKQKVVKFFLNFFFVMAICAGNVAAQTSAATTERLQLGDKAPELRYGKWLKGAPVKQYEPGRLYLVEFWATWCGPCIQMMPHLSKLAKEREKEITIIGVNIWEAHGDSTKPYNTHLPKVERFVNQMGDKMAYNVSMDTDDQYMGNNWMKAAGQEGIPCSFMIKDGIIQWIGHPIEVDSLIAVVNSPTYDVVAARKAADEKKAKSEAEAANGENWRTVYNAFDSAVKQKEFEKAIKIAEGEIAKQLSMASMFSYFKFQAMLENMNEDSAMTFLKKWQKEYGGYGFSASVGVMVCRKPGLKMSSYTYAIAMLKKVAEGPNTIPPLMYHHMAAGYANGKDYKNAITTQQKAITLAKQALKEGKFAGFILEDTIKEYEQALADYKAKLK